MSDPYQQSRVLNRLLRAGYDMWVLNDELIRACYPHPDTEGVNALAAVYNAVSHLRRRGYSIENIYGRYRLRRSVTLDAHQSS